MSSLNKIISIGWLGSKSCYLNISREEAIQRYLVNNPGDSDYLDDSGFITEFEFTDEFWAYSVGEAA